MAQRESEVLPASLETPVLEETEAFKVPPVPLEGPVITEQAATPDVTASTESRAPPESMVATEPRETKVIPVKTAVWAAEETRALLESPEVLENLADPDRTEEKERKADPDREETTDVTEPREIRAEQETPDPLVDVENQAVTAAKETTVEEGPTASQELPV